MDEVAGFPYSELQFGKSGEVVERATFQELLEQVARDAPPDVIVLSHGWNNNMEAARGLYDRLAGQFRAVLESSPPRQLGRRRFLVLGVLWPSKKFAERSLIPGGAATVSGGLISEQDLCAQLDDLRDLDDSPLANDALDAAIELVPRLEDSPAARDQFVDALRSLVPAAVDLDPDDFPTEFRKAAGREILATLEAPLMPGVVGREAPTVSVSSSDDPAGEAAVFGVSAGGIKAGAERALNLTTYYKMKHRAGVVGTDGLNPCLREIRATRGDVRLHLVGHSFGGRLVASATLGVSSTQPVAPDSVSLLQAAFSHYGFARHYDGERDGFFRRLITDKMTRGPVLVTHSVRDIAVGYAYPLASRLARQVASGFGDANDHYGGIGRNGAQKTPEASHGLLGEVGSQYDLESLPIHNLNADRLILDHSDICKPEVAYAVLSAIASASPASSREASANQ